MVQPFVFRGLVEAVDLAPTLLEALGIPAPQSMAGRSWQGDILAGRGAGRESVLVEAGLQIPTAPGPVPGAGQRAPFAPNNYGPGAMVTDGRYKLSMYADDRPELYDLARDPHEMENLYGAPAYAAVQARLTELLVQRVLGAGLRPAGPWTGPGIDVRENPPEARPAAWTAPEMTIGPGRR
jgi:arylsulfatase A-like enzyme